jgi:hypothetical protein
MPSLAKTYHAMALCKLGNVEEGKKQLAQVEAQLGDSLKNLTGFYCWQLGRCQLALDEAHRLCEQQPDSHKKGQKPQKNP